TDLRIVLTAAIETLPEDYRTVVVLRDVEGLSTQEIAQITGLSVASVKVRTHRARLLLRRRPGGHPVDPRPGGADGQGARRRIGGGTGSGDSRERASTRRGSTLIAQRNAASASRRRPSSR